MDLFIYLLYSQGTSHLLPYESLIGTFKAVIITNRPSSDRGRYRGSERLRNFPKVTQLLSERAGMQIQVFQDSQPWDSPIPPPKGPVFPEVPVTGLTKP